jgi:hypothetical protein
MIFLLVQRFSNGCSGQLKFQHSAAKPQPKEMKREYGTNGNNGTNERAECFRLFRTLSVYRRSINLLKKQVF